MTPGRQESEGAGQLAVRALRLFLKKLPSSQELQCSTFSELDPEQRELPE